jgi:uncharacterized membrane protein (DUF106 family)
LFFDEFLFNRRELEQRLRELKRRKKDKKMAKLKEFEEEREKDKKRWTDFNSKVIQLQIIFLSIIFLVLVNESNMERCCIKING